MKWSKKVAAAAALVLGIAAVSSGSAQARPGETPPRISEKHGGDKGKEDKGKEDKGKGDKAKAVKILRRTRAVLAHAAHAVKKGGAGKDDLRKGVVHQVAARKAMKAHDPTLAAKLSLEARGYGKKVIEANKEKPSEDASVEPEERKEADGASDAEADKAAAEVDKSAPPTDEMLKDEVEKDGAAAGEDAP